MGFLGVYKALYDYAPQAEGELQIAEGDVLYVLQKSEEDDWWKVKKRATAEDDDEPVGLIPNNYVEEVPPLGHARALYEYTRQTDEELSFPEEAQLEVFDTSDPDWILVGHDGDYGFVPANYIEMGDGAEGQGQQQPQEEEEEEEEEQAPAPPPLPVRSPAAMASPPLPSRNNMPSEPSSPAAPNPAAALAAAMAGRSAPASHAPPAPINIPPRQQYVSDESEEEMKSPPLPTRPRGDSNISAVEAQSSYRSPRPTDPPRTPLTPQTAALTPGGFHMYNINEMVSVMGKKKKMPTTVGINLKTGIILIAPEHASDGPSNEWPAERMTHYSREGKHVFVELVRPSKSADFHAGAKDTAEEMVAMLGELAGAVRAEGLKEVIMAGTGQQPRKKGVILYDFMAQGDDEVTVGVGDEVIVIDDTKSEEWWQVRRVKNGKEGVVPSSYIELTGSAEAHQPASLAGINAGKSTVEQNRLEEQRLTKEAVKAAQREEHRERERRSSEVGPGMRLPERNSSLSARDGNMPGQQRTSSRRENGRAEGSGSSRSGGKSKPDPSKVRTWTDRSKSFSVEAQFLGMKDGKLNLHKMNGVKIAVPVAKMSLEDLEYVERMTGISLDDDKPLADLKKRAGGDAPRSSGSGGRVGASIDQTKKADYDWFQFFLSCEVAVGLCERYAQAFTRESIDESVLPDVDASVLRNLGLREGDIIKVMRFLDNKYGRNKKAGAGDDEGSGGLFSGPGGTLRNNTRKGRPAPPVETNNVVDPKAFSQQKDGTGASERTASPTTAAPPASAPSSSASKPSGGFDDDAWDVKPSKTRATESAPQPASRAPEPTPPSSTASTATPGPAPKPVAQLTGSMQELSLLTQPLQPEKVQPPAPAPLALSSTPAAPQPAPTPAAPAQFPQPTGVTPGFFAGMQPPTVNGQMAAPQLPQTVARQRPMAPQYTQGQGALMPPPPSITRPLSAPQSAQPSAFTPPPLQPQMTGYQQAPQIAPQIAPPGQSLNDMTQARLQQQYLQAQQQQMQQAQAMMQQQQPMMAGMPGQAPQQTGFGAPNQFMPQPTGMQMQGASPFADPRMAPMQAQPTGFGVFNPQAPQVQVQPQPTGFGAGVNSFLPAPLEPQRTAMPMHPQPTGMGFTQGFGNAQGMGGGLQAPMQPLVPQKTGPPPPVRFGVSAEAKKLAPQPTGRRANLAHATPQNPFGF
ncbi:hypothetical protein QBC46DRAFT_296523 [Diplogelasinospora grovesii]|uniref:Actin cytoskeleton-regulatory complex protein SLA1 n=1 Tax=Diplogelasinospora grovesii TaxID=303347 RepID=A0AAN6S0V2_9PEZI|nr:hypothetical protein QBC46DRAFT_296523 [Diplogelasinospora grovesii]